MALIGLLVVLGLTGGSGDDGGQTPNTAAAKHRAKLRQEKRRKAAQARGPVSVDLTAEAEVWVCLVDAEGSPLVNGQILTTGQEEGPFESGRFTVRFGNGSIQMTVNGQPAPIEDTGSPVGYAIDPGGKVRAIPDTEQPTCA